MERYRAVKRVNPGATRQAAQECERTGNFQATGSLLTAFSRKEQVDEVDDKCSLFTKTSFHAFYGFGAAIERLRAQANAGEVGGMERVTYQGKGYIQVDNGLEVHKRDISARGHYTSRPLQAPAAYIAAMTSPRAVPAPVVRCPPSEEEGHEEGEEEEDGVVDPEEGEEEEGGGVPGGPLLGVGSAVPSAVAPGRAKEVAVEVNDCRPLASADVL